MGRLRRAPRPTSWPTCASSPTSCSRSLAEKLAATDLDFVLDIESDRLRNMTIDFLNLEPEREVVKSERLLRTGPKVLVLENSRSRRE